MAHTKIVVSDPSIHYRELCKPQLSHLLALFKMDYVYTKASQNYLYATRAGRPIRVLDCVGGYGSTILGHNPKVLIDELEQALGDLRPSHAQGSIHGPVGRLACLINNHIRVGFNDAVPYIVHLANTGTEATEGALKHSLMVWQNKRNALIYRLRKQKSGLLSRQILGKADFNKGALIAVDRALAKVQTLIPVFIALDGGFHGKTAGSLAVTNPCYSQMYEPQAIKRVFISPKETIANVKQTFAQHTIDLGAGETFCTIAGAMIEVIQCEGGIKPISQTFVHSLAQACKEYGALLMVDEIQTGVYRTGVFLASERYQIMPDCIMLGKALGGGVTKVSAILINSDKYCPKFSMIHTSTFAEDDLSALVACRALEYLASYRPDIATLAKRFYKMMLEGLSAISERYPGTIKAVRGSGFLIGIEFATNRKNHDSAFLTLLARSGYFASFLASYLLNRHNIRVAATLNNSHTLRIEPPITITIADTQQLLAALEHMIDHLYTGRFLALSSHIWLKPSAYQYATVSSFSPNSTPDTSNLNQVAFITHLIDNTTLAAIDPLFGYLEAEDTKHFIDKIGPLMQGVPYYQQVIAAQNGERVQLTIWGAAVDSRFFEQSLRSGSPEAHDMVRQMAIAAQKSGATHLGLGQFTSIVTNNGLDLSDLDIPITTGNSLTVGSSFLEIKRALNQQSVPTAGLRIGIVGAAGNIGRVMTELLSDIASELLIIHRENISQSSKFQALLAHISQQAPATCLRVIASHKLEQLYTCDVVVICVNSTKTLISTEHLKSGAIVLDISVPSALDASVTARNDITVLYGATIKLPLHQKLNHTIFDVFKGDIYACLAETIITGLAGVSSSFSIGPLTKSKVLESIELATALGFTLGHNCNCYLNRR